MGRVRNLRPRVAQLAPRLAPEGGPRRGWQADAIRGSRHQRGYGREWSKLRLIVLERDARLCQTCKRSSGRLVPGTEVDHVVSKARARELGWTDEEMDDLTNLEAICREHHQAKTLRESRGER